MAKDRYQGKPLLRLLELYVLRAIGHLTSNDESRLQGMAPLLSQTYNVDGSWHEILRAVMEFPPNMPEILAGIWQRNVDAAKAQGAHADPEQFAMAVTDKNFV